jgi:transposase/quinol monooxygenase YgiN
LELRAQEEVLMIMRVFRARLKPGMRDAYEQLVRHNAIPLMRAAPGCVALHVGAPLDQRIDEFVFVSVWTDLASVQAFVGEHWDEALIVPGEADLMDEASVQHYDDAFHSLTELWSDVAEAVRQRELLVTQTPRLSDAQWERVRSLLPPGKREGRPRADDRRTLDGILYVLRTGCRWQDLPDEYGSGVTCWRRLTQWEDDGTWERLWRVFLETLDASGRLAWAQALLTGSCVPSRRGARRAG